MPKLILVKHSQPEILPGLPASRWPLSAEGRRRCIPLANRLALYYPAKIYASPEPKAQETARIAAQKLGLPVRINERLHEHRREQVSLLDRDEFQASIRGLFAHPDRHVFGEETAAEAHTRFSLAVRRLIEQNAGQTLVVVAHGTVISLFAAACCKLEPYEIWKRLGLPSLVIVDSERMLVDDIIDRVMVSKVRQVA
jgi:broad specificity phosphatase PhoE